ncbi:MAG: TOTE conflict system archaeo-eukaryotic primase domain-containing protein [bacterium]
MGGDDRIISQEAEGCKEDIDELRRAVEENPDDFPLRMSLIHALANSGRNDEAKETVLRTLEIPASDPASLVQLGELAEELGSIDSAISSYHKAISLDPASFEAHRNLGQLYLDRGDPGSAMHHLQQAIHLRPDDAPTFRDLASACEEQELLALAEEAYSKALSFDPNLPGLSQKLHDVRSRIREEEESKRLSFTDADVEAFMRLFVGREEVYARQWIDETGRCGYTPVYEPLRPERVREHLSGQLTLGLYPIRNDDTVKFLAIDVDINKVR